mgnify:CR=1 FL=1
MVNVHEHIERYFLSLSTTAGRLDRASIATVITLLLKALQEQRQIFVMGNGGSGSTASHFLNDFNKSACVESPQKFKVICLNDNIPILLAIANDLSYDMVFVEQLKNYLKAGDLVIGISGSGNSRNIIRAIDYANEHGAVTIGLCGYSGGLLKQRAAYSIHVPIDDMQISEDLHLSLMHLMMRAMQAAIKEGQAEGGH